LDVSKPFHPDLGLGRVCPDHGRVALEMVKPAAEEVFAEQRASAFTEEVVRRAGVAIGTVFRHFPTRDDLLRAILREHKKLPTGSTHGIPLNEPARQVHPRIGATPSRQAITPMHLKCCCPINHPRGQGLRLRW
jgi:hypothetical protein